MATYAAIGSEVWKARNPGGAATVRVRVHEYPDGHLAVFHEPRCLARYDGNGGWLDDAKLAA